MKVFTVATAKAMNFGEFCDYNPKNSATVSSDKQKYLMRFCIFSVKSIDFYGESEYNDFLNAFCKITVSREFGSGGRELGKRLAEYMGYDYYDSEIISTVAKESKLDAAYVESMLGNHGWKNMPLTFRGTLGSPAYARSAQVALLLEQKKVIESIAALGKDCVIVGRNADLILSGYKPFNIFVCATKEAKLARCLERAPEDEKLGEKELLRKMKRIDEVRAQTRELMSGTKWGQRDAYHLTVNTTGLNIKELTPAVADFAVRMFDFGR